MKNILIALALTTVAGTARADYLCSTSSGSRFYTEQSYSENEGLDKVIEACQNNVESDYSECIENAACEDRGEHGGGGNPGGGFPGGPGGNPGNGGGGFPGQPPGHGGGNGGFPGQPGGHGGFNKANIQAFKKYCFSELCTYQVSWKTSHSQSSVVTVQIPGESEEKLMSCEGKTGMAQAPWIAKGKVYVFRLYESNNCSQSVSYFQKPAAITHVFEQGLRGL